MLQKAIQAAWQVEAVCEVQQDKIPLDEWCLDQVQDQERPSVAPEVSAGLPAWELDPP